MWQDTVNKVYNTITKPVIDSVVVKPATDTVVRVEVAKPVILPIVERKVFPRKKVEPVVKIEKTEISDTFINPYIQMEEVGFGISVRDTDKSVISDSILFAETEPPGKFELFPLNEKIADFNSLFVFVFLGIGFLLVMLNRFYHNLTEIVLNSAVNKQLSSRVLREKNIALRRSFFVLNIFSVIVLAFFTWFALDYLHISFAIQNPQKAFFVLLLIITSTLIARYILLIIMSKLFIIEGFMTHYLHNNYNLLKATSILVFPILFFSKFSNDILADTFFIIATILFSIMMIYKYIRAVQLLFQFRFLNIYSILYFCTLEILPVFIGLKYFSKLI